MELSMTLDCEKPVTETNKDQSVWLTLNRPHVKNAINAEMIAMLIEAFQRLGNDPTIRAIVLAANGNCFCSGADLEYMRNLSKESESNQQNKLSLTHLFRSIAECPKPVLARVHGLCLAGGLGLVCASDLVLANETVRFGLPEVKRGLIPATISPYVIQAMGVQAARRYFITGETFSAQKAYELGIVHELTKTDTLDKTLGNLLSELYTSAPNALTTSKQLVLNVSHMDTTADQTHNEVAARLAKVTSSAEAAEGIAAFLEKRLPKWMI
jgi:methylglutaconyl-CoA hydratase